VGGGERHGLYYEFCQTNGVEYYDFASAKRRFGNGNEFKGVCQTALDKCANPSGNYDAILVDEAQDFPPAFLRICFEMLNPEKRLVYAYDELQTLNSQSLPSPEKIFGKNPDGSPRVRFHANQPGKPQQDIILEKCYRNSRPILVTAHALGFGIYRTKNTETGTGLVQIFDHHQLWEEVGYKVTGGKLADNCDVTLERTQDSSPLFLEDHSPIDDLIQFHCFNSKKEQAVWLAKAIKYNLKEDELRPDDIVVINPDPFSTKSEVGFPRRLLFEDKINSHLAGVDTSPDIFFDTDNESITFTGIYRAKGNEAGMVYIINAQDCYSATLRHIASLRNRLFTAMTRSKAWVRILGVGENMQQLIKEFGQVKESKFKLNFQYPTKEQRKYLNIVNRDMTEAEHRRVEKKKSDIAQLIEDLESGRVYPEDLGTDKLKRLQVLLGKVEKD
ncbi:MAG: helicase, partial [Candidatus Electrothrix sp. MAN1_4]|nr:helicase [Candidatus Electrothrix sp. MAN1_4]